MRKAYEEYKATGIQWLPKIPRHWAILPLCAIAQEKSIRGCNDLPLLSVYLNAGVIQFSSREEKRTNVTSKDLSKYQRVDVGDFVLNNQQSWRGSVGISAYTGIVSPAYIVLNMHDLLDSIFANYLFRSRFMVDQYLINSKGVGSIQRNIYWTNLKRIRTLVPPRKEQEQIVRFLDWKVSSINKLINLKQQEIFELKQSFSSFLTKELTGLSNTTNIPLKRIFSVPMTDGPHETPKLEETGIPFVSAESAHDGRINLKDCRGYISVEQHKAFCKKVKPQRDDIFIVKSGSTTGKTVIVDFDEEFSIWSPLALIRCNDLAIPKYIFYFCTSELFQKQVRDKWSFGTQPNIGMNVLRDLRVLLPSIVDQNSFVLATDKYWKTVQDLIKLIEQQITNLHDLKSSLIADVVTGQIDVRDVEIPNYEQVEETLYKSDDNDTLQSEDEIPEEV